ncbi:hypothetical protein E4T66_03790 [Sinimarinibacterium sp. CAU 1509]|uniref:FliH/SctL family protein n=1 Tax=Sinimarinibacterium sp. CAU 1509 TaxID=2562283 RepID=UPI0010ABC47D|nr:FliH/SctL family protein [Sinimarinibacterium sp. CAU 1509]TJY62852.1 hypothetical protein E4T66_03790 [Sinimarinibacterium sp. CAU 1509]
MSRQASAIDDVGVLSAEQVGDLAARWEIPVFPTAGQGTPHTAAQLDEIEQAAYQEGFQRGHGEGHSVGQKAALAQAQRLQSLLEHMARPLAHLDEEVERALVELAMSVARRILSAELETQPEAVVEMVRDALNALPPRLREVRLQVHPEDAALLRDRIVPSPDVKDFRIVPDTTLERGDCRVITESALIDARVDSRVRAVALALSGGDSA